MIIITIPKYIREITLSKKQIPVYYELINGRIAAKGKPLLKKYLRKEYTGEPKLATKNDLVPGYGIVAVLNGYAYESYEDYYSSVKHPISRLDFAASAKFVLADMISEKLVIANPAQVGTPRTRIINGQDLYNERVGKHQRAKMMDEIKKSFLPYVRDMPVIDFYPIRIDMEIHDTIKSQFDNTKKNKVGRRWDVGNRAYPYEKAFPDLLLDGYKDKHGGVIMEPKIEDDDRLHVTQPPKAIFCPIEDPEERKLVFKIYKDTREVIINNPFYNGTYKAKEKKQRKRGKQLRIITFKKK